MNGPRDQRLKEVLRDMGATQVSEVETEEGHRVTLWSGAGATEVTRVVVESNSGWRLFRLEGECRETK